MSDLHPTSSNIQWEQSFSNNSTTSPYFPRAFFIVDLAAHHAAPAAIKAATSTPRMFHIVSLLGVTSHQPAGGGQAAEPTAANSTSSVSMSGYDFPTNVVRSICCLRLVS